MDQVEAIVVGAGVIGLAIARELAARGLEVLILEAEPLIGSVTSARNSGVIHAGIYYKQNSLKARLCVEGRKALYAYAADHGVGHKRCGKIIVATSEDQIPRLHEIEAHAKTNGVHDIAWLTGEEARRLEPHVAAIAALLSPSTGIIDAHELMQAYLADAENKGASLALNSPVESVEIAPDHFTVHVGGLSPLTLGCRYLINAGGLFAQKLAHATQGLDPATIPRQTLAKGNYFSITGVQPFKMLVYPIPVAGGLGVHATLDLSGKVRFGPDVEWVDTIDYRVDPARADSFYAAIRRYWPALPDGALQPDYAGVRPKLGPVGSADSEFVIQGQATHKIPRLVNLYGIESPGLTSSLAIGRYAADTLLDK
jgi:L-2-hydroxyglutarate oxidase LhgO